MENPSAERLLETSKEIATYYGFTPLKEFFKKNRIQKKHRKEIKDHEKPLDSHKSELSKILHFVFSNDLDREQIVMLYHSNIDKDLRKAITSSKKKEDASFTLTILGLEDPIAEAILISCATKILESLKTKNIKILLNSMGDKQTSALYFTKLQQVIKGNMDLLDSKCINLCRENICEAHRLLYSEENLAIQHLLPSTVRLLSEKSRLHFQEVINYLDSHEIKYELTPKLVELTGHGGDVLFEIESDSNLKVRGGRFDSLPMHLYKRNLTMTSLNITLVGTKIDSNYSIKPKRKKKPKVFFLHAGHRARLQILPIICNLYDYKIPIAHRIYKKPVSEQMTEEDRNLPYTIILGQNEVEMGFLSLRDNKNKEIVKFNLKKELDRLKRHIK